MLLFLKFRHFLSTPQLPVAEQLPLRFPLFLSRKVCFAVLSSKPSPLIGFTKKKESSGKNFSERVFHTVPNAH